MPRDAPLSALLCFDVYTANLAFGRCYATLLQPHGLTYPQYLVLVALLAEDGQTVSGLAGALGLDSSTLTPLLKRLEGLGHVRRVRDTRDERKVRVHLTAAGAALRAPLEEIPRAVSRATGLSAAELTAAQDLMRRLARGLGDSLRDTPRAG